MTSATSWMFASVFFILPILVFLAALVMTAGPAWIIVSLSWASLGVVLWAGAMGGPTSR